MANLLRYLLGNQETVQQKTASCCPNSGLVEEYECTIEKCTGICLYPNNSTKLVQPSVCELKKDKHLLVYTAITQADTNNKAKLIEGSTGEIFTINEDKGCMIYTAVIQTNPNNAQMMKSTTGEISTAFEGKCCSVKKSLTQMDPHTTATLFVPSAGEISVVKEDKCDLVYTAITQSTLKNTRFSDKSTDLISRIKQIYKECKCNPCDCIAGIELPFDTTCQAAKEGKCSCHPCDCLSSSKIHLQQSRPNETYEQTDGAKDKVLWKEKFFCTIERTANACTCKPCDCVTCNKDKSEFERQAEIQTNAIQSFNYDCRCNPCECLFCKARTNPECDCRPCECKTCPNLFISKKSILPESICILNTASLRDCAPKLRKPPNNIMSGTDATLNEETKATPIPINFKEKLPSFYCRIVANMPESEEVGITVPTTAEYTTPKEKDTCDCTKCECVCCENRDIKSSSTASLTEDGPCKNCNLLILKCSCETCECKVCKKRKTKHAEVSFRADEGEITCLCKDEGRPKCICGSEYMKEERKKCFVNCDQCRNNNHKQCTNELSTEEANNEFNFDGCNLPFLKNDSNIYAIPTVAMGGFLNQIRTETSTDTNSHHLLTDIYDMNEVTKSYSAEEKQASYTQSVRYVDKLKLPFCNNDLDTFVDFDNENKFDLHIDDSNKCLYHYKEKIIDETSHIWKTNMDLSNETGNTHFKTSDLLPIVDEIDEEMLTKNYFLRYRPFSNKSSVSNVMCQYACTCAHTYDHSKKPNNLIVKYEYDLLKDIGIEIDVLINRIRIDNTKIVARTKPIRKSSNIDINQSPDIYVHVEKRKNMKNNNKSLNKINLLKYLDPRKHIVKK